MLKETTAVDAPSVAVENIPEELRRRPQWVCWRYEERGDKRTKVPVIAGGVGRASTADVTTWRTFEEVLRALETGRYAGVGFVFSDADPFAGIDLDNCRNPETGRIAPWAQEILNDADGGYAEISPSGTGVHIIVEGTVRGGGMRKGPIEMYSRGRFFTMTGRAL